MKLEIAFLGMPPGATFQGNSSIKVAGGLNTNIFTKSSTADKTAT